MSDRYRQYTESWEREERRARISAAAAIWTAITILTVSLLAGIIVGAIYD